MTTLTASPTTNSTSTPTRRERGWPLWLRCLVAVLGMVTTAFSPALLMLIPAAARAMQQTKAGEQTAGTLAWTAVAWVLPTLLALVLIPALVRLEGLSPGKVLAPRGWRELGIGLAVACGIALVTAVAAGLAQLMPGGRPTPAAGGGLPAALVIVMGLEKAFLLQGVPEELWFRGFGWLGRGRPGWATLTATTLAFTVLHLASTGDQQNLVERFLYLAFPFGMGLCAGALRWCFGSTGAAIGVHGGTHTGSLVLTLLAWNSGVAAWIFVGTALCLVAVAALLLRRPWRDAQGGTAPAHGSR